MKEKLLMSTEWIQLENETDEEFNSRIREQLKEYDQDRKKGLLIFEYKTLEDLKYGDPFQYRRSKDILDSEAVKNKYCKICHNEGSMKVFNPKYPEGFYDKGGLAAQPCICVLRGLIQRTAKKKKKGIKLRDSEEETNIRKDING